jgi:hypothetical protein
MDTLLNRFREKVNGVITGFDRIVFKGMIRPIMHAVGMESFLISRKILNKDFKDYAIAQSKAIVESAEEMAKSQTERGITYIPSTNERKETLAHNQQKESGVKEGLIGIWSCVESCNTFRSTYNPAKTYPSLKSERSKCKHLYFYLDDSVYGFMNVRLQTWAPYEIQVALNGREWLRRSLDTAGCGYVMNGNKFLHIDDYDLAQGLLDAQIRTDFSKVLNGFLPIVFPRMAEILNAGLSYYWTCWQSEIAKDYIFKDGDTLRPLMDDFQLHALVTGKGDRILKYFGSPSRANGQPHHLANPEIMSRTNTWYDGLRVRHWNNKNSVKFYNEHNVLRFEATINDPTKFKIHRHSENQHKDEPEKFLPMRKGITDTAARADVSKNIINQFTEHMSAVEEKIRLGDLLNSVNVPLVRDGKRVRALDVFGKDRELIRAISDPSFNVHAITNKELQNTLKDTPWAKNMSDKQLSGRISRHLRLLREHGLIEKLSNQRKYVLTDKGRKLTAALDAALSASVNELLKSAA